MAVALLVTRQKTNRRPAALAGLAAGLLPDADIALRSASDPLFTLEYHRQFTHSLAFSPIIALLAAGFAVGLYRLFNKRCDWKILLFPAWLAGLSHIFCDVWTSYGTQVWWPFSGERVALDWISVIDPLFTVPLAACVALALRYGNRKAAASGLAWGAVYLTFCVIQQHRATRAVNDWLSAEMLPPAQRLSVRPSFGNALVWRGMAVNNGICRVVAVRCGWPGNIQLIPGGSARLLPSPTAAAREFDIPAGSVQAVDIARFHRFSDGWIGRHPDQPDILADLRYATVPDEIRPMWGIRLTPAQADQHAAFLNFREATGPSIQRLLNMMKGKPAVDR